MAQLGAPVAAVAAGIAGPGRVEPNWICGQRDVGPSDPDLVDGRSQGQHERASYPRGIPQTPAGPLATRDPGRKAEPQHPGRSASGTPDATLFVQHLSSFVYLSLLSPSPPTPPLAAPNPSGPSHRVRTIAPLTCLCPSRPPKAPLPELQRTPTPYVIRIPLTVIIMNSINTTPLTVRAGQQRVTPHPAAPVTPAPAEPVRPVMVDRAVQCNFLPALAAGSPGPGPGLSLTNLEVTGSHAPSHAPSSPGLSPIAR